MQNTDSLEDTWKHIERVRELMAEARLKLSARAKMHDASKLVEPEKSGFDRLMSLKLSGMVYGSPEYRAALAKEKPAIEHHYQENDHHPEYYKEEGIAGMSLLAVVEMLVDWKAASERMENGGDIYASIVHNCKRFNIDGQLGKILMNTAHDFGW